LNRKILIYTASRGPFGAISGVIRVTQTFNYLPTRFTPERAHGGRRPSPSVCEFVQLLAIHV
jgi:hypothetical protein